MCRSVEQRAQLEMVGEIGELRPWALEECSDRRSIDHPQEIARAQSVASRPEDRGEHTEAREHDTDDREATQALR